MRYPNVVYTGCERGDDLARRMAPADVSVFPSLANTFGLVLPESPASGVPVAAFPVTGPIDLAADPQWGCLDRDRAKAARTALAKRPEECRVYAENFSWRAGAEIFLGNLQPFGAANPAACLAPALMSE